MKERYVELEAFLNEFENSLCYSVVDGEEIFNWQEFVTFKEPDSVDELMMLFDRNYYFDYYELNNMWRAMPRAIQIIALNKNSVDRFISDESKAGIITNIERYLHIIINEIDMNYENIKQLKL